MDALLMRILVNVLYTYIIIFQISFINVNTEEGKAPKLVIAV